MQYLAHAGLALATSITAWLNAAILTFILKQKGLHQHSKETYVKLVRTFMASAVMGMGLLGLIEFVGDSMFDSKNSNILSLAALILLGLFLYIIPVFLFRVIRLSEVRQEIKSWVKNNQ
jgi:putative peptidoglycan lipid II flippase